MADCYCECDSFKMKSLLGTPGSELRVVSCNMIDFLCVGRLLSRVNDADWNWTLNSHPSTRCDCWCSDVIIALSDCGRQHACCCGMFSSPSPLPLLPLPLPSHNGANLIVNYHCPHPPMLTGCVEPVQLQQAEFDVFHVSAVALPKPWTILCMKNITNRCSSWFFKIFFW